DANVTELVQRLKGIDLNQVESATGVSRDDIVATARLFVTGHLQETPLASAPGELVGSVVHTVAHDYNVTAAADYPDAKQIAEACTNLSILTGNLGRAGGGVASPRGNANYQGTTDMGLLPDMLPGGQPITDAKARATFEQ